MPNKIRARKIAVAETGSPEWFAARRGKMTGSRIAAALGLSPWTSPFTLYYQLRGDVPESVETNVMEWGTRLEPAVIQKYADLHPNVRVVRNAGVWQSIEYPFLVASPDALLIRPGVGGRRRPDSLLEVKTSQYDFEWDQGVPVWYVCQVIFYLLVFGFESADVAVLFSGSDYREFTVWYDETDAKMIVDASAEFLDRVARNIVPDLDGSTSTYETIRARHPEIDGSSVDVPMEIVAALADVREVLDRFTEEQGLVINQLALEMGSAHLAYCNTTKVADRRAKGLTGKPYVQLAPIKTIRKALQWEQSAQQ